MIAPRSLAKNVAAQAAKLIIDRFCGGSLEELLVGLVDNDVVSRKELQQLARRIVSKKPGVEQRRNIC